ncbi:hypothetical protein B0180_01090 [Moraxella canis]|uniref:DUF7944 domain-containing protein n=2 Tax=Moraxella canis TaxID=90239 RepID=A0A1S9ZPN2_9GAMM|nr:hypothetical protein B0180_01090 [Moraxella canis]
MKVLFKAPLMTITPRLEVAALRDNDRLFLSCVQSSAHRLGMMLFVMLSLGVCAAASANNTTPRYQRISSPQAVSTQEIYLTATQYELALIQVLSEICPPVLNARQKANFNRAYDRQLRIFMPRSADPYQSLRQLSTQREYRMVLHNVRAWTASFPASENRALCYEFAASA